MRAFLFALLAATLAVPAFARKPITVETVADGPKPVLASGFVWSPDGSQVVYTKSEKFWLQAVTGGAPRELLTLKDLSEKAAKVPDPAAFDWKNRGVREQPVQWFPSGRSLLIAAGGDLFQLDLAAGAAAQQLTKTPLAEADPKLSPNGLMVAFRRGHELFTLNLATKRERQLTHDSTATRWNAELDWVYPEELALGTAYWWSPDSMRIAYLQFDVSGISQYPHASLLGLRAVAEPQRYPYAGTPNPDVRLGVVTVQNGKTRWMDTNGSKDQLLARVDWLPNSRELAVQMLPRIQNQLAFQIVDSRSGKVRTLFEEKDKHWIDVASDLRFLKDGSFVFSSERDGFRHLYLHRGTAIAGAFTPLTKGAWEVQSVDCVDEEEKTVYFTASKESPLRRDLYQVSLDGSNLTRVSQGEGTHASSLPPSCGYRIDTFSSLRNPHAQTLYDRKGKQIAVISEPSKAIVEEYEVLETRLIEFRDASQRQFHARLILPAGFQEGRKYPAVAHVYGGPHAQNVRDAWSGLVWDQALAHRGFVVWQMDNRGTAARGQAWETPLYRRLGATELEDQQAGIRHLISLGFVDAARIGVYGWSYGGFMTLYALLNAPDLFRAGIAGAPVTDWNNYDTIYTERYLGTPQQNPEGYKASSPVHSAKNLKAPLLLIHNVEDDNVLFQNTLQMMSALQNAGKPFDLAVYPQKSHGVTGPAFRHMLETMTGFFDRHLK